MDIRGHIVKRLFAGLVCVVLGGAVHAQEGPAWDLQRCIWSCLANSPGATSFEYNQCVANYCTEEEAPSSVMPQMAVWSVGRASDGQTMFAGAQVPGGAGEGIYFMCHPAQAPYLLLHGFDRPPGMYRLAIDGRSYNIPFDMSRGQLTVTLQPGAQLTRLMGQGQWLTLFGPGGGQAARLSLSGAAGAMAQAQAQCR